MITQLLRSQDCVVKFSLVGLNFRSGWDRRWCRTEHWVWSKYRIRTRSTVITVEYHVALGVAFHIGSNVGLSGFTKVLHTGKSVNDLGNLVGLVSLTPGTLIFGLKPNLNTLFHVTTDLLVHVSLSSSDIVEGLNDLVGIPKANRVSLNALGVFHNGRSLTEISARLLMEVSGASKVCVIATKLLKLVCTGLVLCAFLSTSINGRAFTTEINITHSWDFQSCIDVRIKDLITALTNYLVKQSIRVPFRWNFHVTVLKAHRLSHVLTCEVDALFANLNTIEHGEARLISVTGAKGVAHVHLLNFSFQHCGEPQASDDRLGSGVDHSGSVLSDGSPQDGAGLHMR